MPDSARLQGPEDPSRLFEEFVQACEASGAADPHTYLARAGGRASELQRRIDVYATLREISSGIEVDGATPEPAPPEPAPVQLERLGRFTGLVQIGQGGLSRVFLAHDPELGREVALKVLLPARLVGGRERAWIRNEGRVLAHLQHPGVVRVYELGEADGFAYLAMEHVAGPSLYALLEELRRLDEGAAAGGDPAVVSAARALQPIAARCRLALRIARALEYCHQAGVVHRDLKPGNVLLESGVEPKLIDFGLGNLETQAESLTDATQMLVGTPAYLSPEQVDQSRTLASPKSDQFALGALLYELMTLVSPFHKPTRQETLDAVSRALPQPPRRLNREIPEDLERICLHALARAPAARYPTVGALADDLEAFLEHRAVSLQRPSPAKVLRLWLQRNAREAALAGGAFAVVAAFAIGGWLWSGVKARRAFRAELEDIGARIARAHEPKDFHDIYPLWRGADMRAADLDGEWVAQVLGADSRAAARHTLAACSHRVASLLDGLFSESMKQVHSETGEPLELRIRQTDRSILAEWDSVLQIDALLCADSALDGHRARGRVVFPEAGPGERVAVYRFAAPVARFPVLELVDEEERTRKLQPGAYRFEQRSDTGELQLQMDFEVWPELLPRRLQPRPLAPSLRERMIRVEAADVELQEGTFRVEAFWITPRPVTWAEIEQVLGADAADKARRQCEAMLMLSPRPEGPAVVPWSVAADHAAALGARLPTAAELCRAWKDPRVSTPDAAFKAELFSGNIDLGPVQPLRYSARVSEQGEFDATFRYPPLGYHSVPTVFRLAYGTPP